MRRTTDSGFTLLEIMIVVGIISVLAVIGIPNLLESQRTAQERAGLETMRGIFNAQQQHHRKFGVYADSLDALAAAGLLTDPFGVGKTNVYGMQQKGWWEFCTRIPAPSTIKTGLPTPSDLANRQTRFRITMEPVGNDTNDRLKRGDQMYFMLEDRRMYTHRYGAGCSLSHASSTAVSSSDDDFGPVYYPETEGQ
jgi:prepilin-type N-terminal cleavage/methylation domain-containing protein